nr:hypothetical protein [Tanacetum cinerariifolium]
MENLNEVKVKELRSNNGTEFKNHKLEEFGDDKGISQNFSSPYTPKQNGVAKRRNRTFIEAARTMLNSVNLPKQFWGEAVNTACYTQNRSIIVKRHGKTACDVFRGRSSDISYFYVFGCHVYIHNHRDHLGKFDEKADDGFFLGYSLVAKSFRVFNIRRQEMKETYHVTFSEDDEAISQSSTEGDAINFNEIRSFPDDEFQEPKRKPNQESGNNKHQPYVPAYDPISFNNISIPECLNSGDSHQAQDSVSPEDHTKTLKTNNDQVLSEPNQHKSVENLVHAKVQTSVLNEQTTKASPTPLNLSQTTNPLVPQDRWSKDKHIELFEGNKAWILVPLPNGKTINGTKWIYKNKMDEYGIVIKNKARLVAQGYRQEEGIDYDETFAHVARLEAIRIFLAYAAYMCFTVYQMDVKSALLNGKISKELYAQQPPRFESSEFPNHVCKLDKALYGLKQAPKAWYQANPKESHLVAVKRIFRKSTSGGCQILGGKLVCWSVKKQSSVAMSSAEAEYVAAAGCCAQVLWIKSQLADYDILYDKVPIFCDNTSATAILNNPMLHSKTKHIDIMYHFIKDRILKRDIKLHFVLTDLQLADIFTKPLAEPSFTRLVAELESSTQQQPQTLKVAPNVHFECEDAKLAFKNCVALLTSKVPAYNDMLQFLTHCCISKALTIQPFAVYNKYLREFRYTVEVVDNTITFSLSHHNSPLSFDRDVFTSVIGLNYTNDFIPLLSHEAVKESIATLGLSDEKNPEVTSADLAHSSSLRIRYFTST